MLLCTVFHTFYVQLHQDCWLSRPRPVVLGLWQLPRGDSVQNEFAEAEDVHGGRGVLLCVGVVTHDARAPLLLMLGFVEAKVQIWYQQTSSFQLRVPNLFQKVAVIFYELDS